MALHNVTLFEFLNKTNEPEADLLPMVHTSETAALIDILNSRELRPSPCQFFEHKEYLYMFLGRPSYRLDDISDPEIWQLPTVFILKNDIEIPVRVHPFDTGAFKSNRYPDYMAAMNLDEYLLPDAAAIRKYIGTFYGDTGRYFHRRAVSQSEMQDKYNLTLRHKAISGLSRMISEKVTSSLDDRRAAIELQFDKPISISFGNLVGIVVPREILRDKELKSEIGKFCSEVITYDQNSLSVREYYSEIYEKCKAFYRRKKAI